MRKITFRVLIAISGIILIWLLLSLPNTLPLPANNNSILRVGTINLNYENKSSTEVSKSLIKTDFDILVILEWQGKNLDLKKLDNAGYKVFLNQPRKGTHGVCIVGKNSWNLQTSLIPSPVLGPCPMPIATARFKLNNQNITLLGVHVPPPVPTCKETTIPTIQKICSWIEKGVLKQNIGIGKKGDTVIIAGDLNMYPCHPQMNCFKEAGLQDIFEEGSWRFRPTWSPKGLFPAIIRLDYIFSSSIFAVSDSYSFTVPGSDHRGVIGDLKVRK
jgi:endonuclease/exonuclease/phosphatase (EEP) superfamily protein YafD